MTTEAGRKAKALLSQLLDETKGRRWGQKLSEFPQAEAIFSSDPEVQRETLLLTLEAIRQGLTHSTIVDQTVVEVSERLLRRKLPLVEADLKMLVDITIDVRWSAAHTLTAIERYAKGHAMSKTLQSVLDRLAEYVREGWLSNQEQQRLFTRIGALKGEIIEERIDLDDNDPWVIRLFEDLAQLEDSIVLPVQKLVAHLGKANGSKPSTKWLKQADALAADLDGELIRACLTVWISAFEQPRAQENPNHYTRSPWLVVEKNADMMKGMIWLASRYADDDLVRAISLAGLSGQKKIPGLGPRSAKVSNAAVWALSQIDRPLAIGQLAIMRSKITNKATQKVIDKAIQTVAERLQVPADEVEEMAVPTYGLTEVGKRTEQFGDFTAVLHITGTTTTELKWIKPDGKPQKSVPKSVKDEYADGLKELKTADKDIKKFLPSQRDRIDLVHLKGKTWTHATWAERYLNHPLVGTLARRLIWSFGPDGSQAATWLDDQLVDAAGESVQVDTDSTVSLWHPVGRPEQEVLAWRRFFEDREIRQPFKQAHREVYLLTDAERNTGTYSNRYASHVLKQHQYNALCGVRGWNNSLRLCVDDEYAPSSLNLPEWNLRAEFWVEGSGDEYGIDTNETGVYNYLATDQVRFYSIDSQQLTAHASGGGYSWGGWRQGEAPDPLPLDQIPALVFSEVMRDVDLFVGVSSVGNDPSWEDGGPQGRHREYWATYSFGDLSATAKTRREILERLIPKLKIADRCSFDDKFLIVRGDRRTYKIHMGSSNILMEPNDQYLCIVPGRGAGPGDKVFLPFEGDQRLSVILSKAMMLADDKKITDKTILTQIG